MFNYIKHTNSLFHQAHLFQTHIFYHSYVQHSDYIRGWPESSTVHTPLRMKRSNIRCNLRLTNKSVCIVHMFQRQNHYTFESYRMYFFRGRRKGDNFDSFHRYMGNSGNDLLHQSSSDHPHLNDVPLVNSIFLQMRMIYV